MEQPIPTVRSTVYISRTPIGLSNDINVETDKITNREGLEELFKDLPFKFHPMVKKESLDFITSCFNDLVSYMVRASTNPYVKIDPKHSVMLIVTFTQAGLSVTYNGDSVATNTTVFDIFKGNPSELVFPSKANVLRYVGDCLLNTVRITNNSELTGYNRNNPMILGLPFLDHHMLINTLLIKHSLIGNPLSSQPKQIEYLLDRLGEEEYVDDDVSSSKASKDKAGTTIPAISEKAARVPLWSTFGYVGIILIIIAVIAITLLIEHLVF